MTAQLTANSWWVGATTNTNPEVDTNAPTNQEQSGAGLDALRIVWALDAFLWLVTGVAVALAAVERWFGVFSGFTLLIGPTPALLLALSLNVGVAAALASTYHAGDRLARLMAPVRFGRFWRRTSARVEATTPQWKVRTTPKPAQRRTSASRRVMEMEI